MVLCATSFPKGKLPKIVETVESPCFSVLSPCLCQSRIVAEDYGNGGITMFFFVLSHFEVLGFARTKTLIGSMGVLV